MYYGCQSGQVILVRQFTLDCMKPIDDLLRRGGSGIGVVPGTSERTIHQDEHLLTKELKDGHDFTDTDGLGVINEFLDQALIQCRTIEKKSSKTCLYQRNKTGCPISSWIGVVSWCLLPA